MKYNDKESDWRKAEITDVLPFRSYNLRFADGTVRRRNSKHIRFSAESPTVYEYDSDEIQTPSPENSPPGGHLSNIRRVENRPISSERRQIGATPSGESPIETRSARSHGGEPPPTAPTVTRSGRVIKRPARYK